MSVLLPMAPSDPRINEIRASGVLLVETLRGNTLDRGIAFHSDLGIPNGVSVLELQQKTPFEASEDVLVCPCCGKGV
jgi:hypothetical protein